MQKELLDEQFFLLCFGRVLAICGNDCVLSVNGEEITLSYEKSIKKCYGN